MQRALCLPHKGTSVVPLPWLVLKGLSTLTNAEKAKLERVVAQGLRQLCKKGLTKPLKSTIPLPKTKCSSSANEMLANPAASWTAVYDNNLLIGGLVLVHNELQGFFPVRDHKEAKEIAIHCVVSDGLAFYGELVWQGRDWSPVFRRAGYTITLDPSGRGWRLS